jgi:hypothetical protein
MSKRTLILTVVLGLCLGSAVQAANIIWVSFHPGDSTPSAGAAGTGFTTAPDKAYTDLLQANGYTVTRYVSTATPDTAVINAADLVIISRSVASANYQNAAATTWNRVTAPMMILNGYVIRQSRMGFATGDTIPDITGDITLTVSKPAHPIFAGIPLSGGTMVNPYAGIVQHPTTGATMRGISIVTQPANANGTVLATVSAAGNGPAGAMVIAEWPAGATVTHAGGGGTDVLGGPRLVILTGGRETNGVSAETAGYYDLRPDGARMFVNAVMYMLGEVANPGLASTPQPEASQTDVIRDTALSWTAGKYPGTHDVYLGTTEADVTAASRTSPNGLLVSQGQSAASYSPTVPLAFSQTYFWRVDEVNSTPDASFHKGNVWSFTVEPFSYPITTPINATASSFSNVLTGPEKTIDGSGLNANDQHSTSETDMWLSKSKQTPIWIQYEFDGVYKLHQMWVWNSNQLSELDLGLGAKDVTIEVSIDGNTWTPLANVPEFAQASAEDTHIYNTIVNFGGVSAKYVRLNIDSNWGGLKQAGLSEVRFFYIPVEAYQPQPASGATGVALDATLDWRPGREATRHELILGTDPNAVTNATVQVYTLTEHHYDLNTAGVEYDRTYYWKVNEVNEAANPTTWEGDLWSFSTLAYTVVEDFESYNDLCNKIFYTWVDQSGYNAPAECGGAGAPGNGSGAIVGNAQTPYAEQTIIHGGNQSMPMAFDNTMNPYYSETQREWTTPQVWTAGGANTLKVFFRGEAPAFLETSPGNIVMSGLGTDIYNTADQGRFAYKSLTGDGSIVARVESLAITDPWSKAGVMIRETLDSGSTFAMAVLGSQNGVRIQMRLTTGVAATSDSTTAAGTGQITARAPVWLKIERKGNQFFAYYSTETGNPTTWTPVTGNPQTITMASTVYIGLAVTSHTAATDTTDIVCGARFSSISTQGNVTGSWLLADLGITQPTGGNAPETFYVAVQDGSGKMKVVSHPDPVAIASGAWEEWNVPLSQITSAGINLSNVKKLIIGVGDRNAPKAGGAGKVYIDDIRLTRVTAP